MSLRERRLAAQNASARGRGAGNVSNPAPEFDIEQTNAFESPVVPPLAALLQSPLATTPPSAVRVLCTFHSSLEWKVFPGLIGDLFVFFERGQF